MEKFFLINMKERKREPFSKSLNFSLVKSSYQLYCLPMDQKKFKIFLIHKLQRMIAEDFIDPTAEERALKGFEKDYASIYFAHAIFWRLSSLDK